MKKVLILGAGMVVKPMVHYLLNNGIEVTIASRTKSKAEKVLEGYENGKAVSWTVDQADVLDKMVKTHDLTVSLLPYAHHVAVAEKCIEHRKNMITTSYISPAMKALSKKAEKAGILIMNEIGVDPGFDHMTAMEIIDRVHEKGGKVDEFYSLCGALCSPEAADNPFRYKFSWSPKGVVMASNNGAQYLKNGTVVNIETADLFKNPMLVDFPKVDEMHVYPNRDSLPYIELYGIPETNSMYRGTFRYKGWCESLDLLKALKLTSYDELELKGKTYAQITAEINNFNPENLKEEIKKKFRLSEDDIALKAVEWLGVLENKKIALEKGSAFDFTSDLMIDKMMMKSDETDIVLMQHDFTISLPEGEKQKITARMLDKGNSEYTSIARTVALPAAICAKLVLEGKISDTGVWLPIKKSIYWPVLDELKEFGIYMKETVKTI